jgi:hypothetical protein
MVKKMIVLSIRVIRISRRPIEKSLSNLSFLGLGAGETQLPATLEIDLSEAQAGIVKLNAVDELLEEHKREANAGNYPRHCRIHLVRTGKFESRRAEGIGEDLGEDRSVDLSTGLKLGTDSLDRLDEVGRDERRREAEEVESDEEELVESAKGEEDILGAISN